MVHPGEKITGTFQVIPSDSVGTVATPLRSCFSFVLISSFNCLAISLDMITKLALGSTIAPGITRHLILHLVVTTSVAGSFL